MEARVYAEDPDHGFLPSTGRIVALQLPDTIRVDSGIEAGGEVTPFYDAMIAKLIAHAPTREAALDRLAAALDRTLLPAFAAMSPSCRILCSAEAFRRGRVDTGFIDRSLDALGAVPQPRDFAAAALGLVHLLAAHAAAAVGDDDNSEVASPWAARDCFQLGGIRSVTLPILVDGSVDATVSHGRNGVQVSVGEASPAGDGDVFDGGGDAQEVYVLRHGRQTRVRVKDFSTPAAAAGGGDGVVKAPMHGRVLEVLAAVGEPVTHGQRLAVIEAMKMEHTLRAPFAGIVTQVPVGSGAQVVEGAPIMVIEPLADPVN